MEESDCRPWVGFVLLSAGLLLAAVTVCRPDWPRSSGRWPVLLVAGIFSLVGIHTLRVMVFAQDPTGRLSSLMAALVYAGFSGLGLWILFHPDLELAGGIPGFPPRWNQFLGRALFGFGALITATAAGWFLFRACRQKEKPH